MSGETTAMLNATVNADVYYRMRITCTATSDSSFTNTVFVKLKNFYNCYCTSNATSNSFGDIISLSYSGVTTPSATVCQPYTDNTAIVFNGLRNVPMSFSALIDLCSGSSSSTYHTRVYMDLNQNGLYTDAGEEVFYQTSGLGSTVSGLITIPPTALLGVTGMRVVTTTTAGAGPCGTYTYGETEDYLLNIVDPTPCSIAPNGVTITASADSVCLNESVNISASSLPSETGVHYQWQKSIDGGFTWVSMPGDTFTILSTTITADASFRLKSVCTATQDSSFTSSVTVELKSYLNCYCTSNATSALYADIMSVSVAGLTVTSATTCTPYTFNPTPIFNIYQNVPTAIDVNVDACQGASTHTTVYHTRVYIDLNQNGSFSDPGENVFYQSASMGNIVSSNVTIPGTALTGITGMRVVTTTTTAATDCGTYTYGETEDFYINIANQPANEVSLVSIDSPKSSQCSFGSIIEVTLKNNGTDTLNSVLFDVDLNGLVINNIAWAGTIAPDSAQSVIIPGVFAFNDGDSLEVIVKEPNGVVDYTLDNRLKTGHVISLSGSYSVGYGVTDLPNKLIADLPTAIQIAQQRGVCSDTVYFNLKDDTYANTQFQIQGNYLDYSPGNMIIIQSESKDAANLIMNFAATGTANNFIFELDDTRGWGFKHMTFNPDGTTYRTVIDIINGSSNILVDSCVFVATQGVSPTYSVNSSAISAPSGSKAHNVKVYNSYFQDFSIGLRSYGASSEYLTGHELVGNTFRNMHSVVFYGYYLQNPLVLNNDIVMDTIAGGPTTQYTFYLAYINGAQFSRNSIQANDVQHTFYLSSTNVAGSDPYVISNNFIYNSFTGTGNVSAIYSTSATNSGVEFVNNSISLRGNSTTYAAMYMTNGSSFNIYNNNIFIDGNMRIMNITNASTVFDSDHNNFFTTGNLFGTFAGTLYNSFNDYVDGSGFDLMSVSVDPMFNGADLHTCAIELEGAGKPLTMVTHDFDGDARNILTPDIGADEFIGSASDLILDAYIDKCENASVLIGESPIGNVSYLWLPTNETTAQINVSLPGIYKVIATTTCGSFEDSIEVVNLPPVMADFQVVEYGLAALLTNTSTNANTYHWNFGDGNTSTEENPYHVYASEDVYLITLTVFGDCDTVTKTFLFNAVALSTEELSFQNMKLYPNPTTDILYLEMPHAQQDLIDLQIIDMTGKTVLMQSNVSGTNLSVDAHTLRPGMYQLKLISNKGAKVMPFVKK